MKQRNQLYSSQIKLVDRSDSDRFANDDLIPIRITKNGPTIHRWWEQNGECWERHDDKPAFRRPDCDYGTPLGDLLVDPWMQEILKKDGAK